MVNKKKAHTENPSSQKPTTLRALAKAATGNKPRLLGGDGWLWDAIGAEGIKLGNEALNMRETDMVEEPRVRAAYMYDRYGDNKSVRACDVDDFLLDYFDRVANMGHYFHYQDEKAAEKSSQDSYFDLLIGDDDKDLLCELAKFQPHTSCCEIPETSEQAREEIEERMKELKQFNDSLPRDGRLI